ncbi:hypothetical protein ACQVP2_20740 [Methylobacterium aquaticum]
MATLTIRDFDIQLEEALRATAGGHRSAAAVRGAIIRDHGV